MGAERRDEAVERLANLDCGRGGPAVVFFVWLCVFFFVWLMRADADAKRALDRSTAPPPLAK